MAKKSLDRLHKQTKKVPLIRLRGVLPKKIKEFNKLLKQGKIGEFDSSDLSAQLKYRHIQENPLIEKNDVARTDSQKMRRRREFELGLRRIDT